MEKAHLCRSFVRVRPFTAKEAVVCPPDSAIPREIIRYDGKDTLTVLDPQNGFEPRKNGRFITGNVLWSFIDSESTVVTATQKDVYARVVEPMIPSIVEGYNAAFCVAGGASSGRGYTFYGEDIDGPNRGILPRFAEDIFDAFSKQKRENSFLAAEIEVIEISGDNYIDMLAGRRSKLAADQELKVISTPNGPRLSGATALDVSGPGDFRTILKQASKNVGARNTTHTVTIRFTETYEFDDPENYGQSVNKSRRVQVLFALMRNLPPAFQRCVDVAVEHDGGENPMAKVPTRETAFTRLFPELLQQGYNANYISCISPYYEHVREDVNTLQFVLKTKKLKCKPQLNQDESLVEMRRLADEVKDLKVVARKQSETMNVVQRELNAREVELMKQEAAYNRVNREILDAEQSIQEAADARDAEALKNKKARKQVDKELAVKRKEIQAVQSAKAGKDEEAKKAQRAADDAKVRTQVLEDKIAKQKENTKAYQRRLDAHMAEEKAVEEVEAFNIASPDEQERIILSKSELHKPAERELEKLQKEQADFKAADDTEQRLAALKPEYDKVYLAEKPSREKEELLKEIAQLEKEIADAESETRRLQAEIDQKKSQCGCTVM